LDFGVEVFIGCTGEKYMTGFEIFPEEEVDKGVSVFEFSPPPNGLQTFCSGNKEKCQLKGISIPNIESYLKSIARGSAKSPKISASVVVGR
jgi:hypothetical protein